MRAGRAHGQPSALLLTRASRRPARWTASRRSDPAPRALPWRESPGRGLGIAGIEREHVRIPCQRAGVVVRGQRLRGLGQQIRHAGGAGGRTGGPAGGSAAPVVGALRRVAPSPRTSSAPTACRRDQSPRRWDRRRSRSGLPLATTMTSSGGAGRVDRGGSREPGPRDRSDASDRRPFLPLGSRSERERARDDGGDAEDGEPDQQTVTVRPRVGAAGGRSFAGRSRRRGGATGGVGRTASTHGLVGCRPALQHCGRLGVESAPKPKSLLGAGAGAEAGVGLVVGAIGATPSSRRGGRTKSASESATTSVASTAPASAGTRWSAGASARVGASNPIVSCGRDMLSVSWARDGDRGSRLARGEAGRCHRGAGRGVAGGASRPSSTRMVASIARADPMSVASGFAPPARAASSPRSRPSSASLAARTSRSRNWSYRCESRFSSRARTASSSVLSATMAAATSATRLSAWRSRLEEALVRVLRLPTRSRARSWAGKRRSLRSKLASILGQVASADACLDIRSTRDKRFPRPPGRGRSPLAKTLRPLRPRRVNVKTDFSILEACDRSWPSCSSRSSAPPAEAQWRAVEPGGQTVFSDRLDLPFLRQPGDPAKLLVEFEGGGGCWNDATCATSIYSRRISIDPVLAEQSGLLVGIYDRRNPENPFRDWTHVYVPIARATCTGATTTRRTRRPAGPTLVRDRGAVNAAAAVSWAFENVPAPRQCPWPVQRGRVRLDPLVGAPHEPLQRSLGRAALRLRGGSGAARLHDAAGQLGGGRGLAQLHPVAGPGSPRHLARDDGRVLHRRGRHYPLSAFSQFNRLADSTQVFFYILTKAALATTEEWAAQMLASVAPIRSANANFSAYTAPGTAALRDQQPRPVHDPGGRGEARRLDADAGGDAGARHYSLTRPSFIIGGCAETSVRYSISSPPSPRPRSATRPCSSCARSPGRRSPPRPTRPPLTPPWPRSRILPAPSRLDGDHGAAEGSRGRSGQGARARAEALRLESAGRAVDLVVDPDLRP